MNNDEQQDMHIDRGNPVRDEIKNRCINMISDLEETLLEQSDFVYKIYRTVLGKNDTVLKFDSICILS